MEKEFIAPTNILVWRIMEILCVVLFLVWLFGTAFVAVPLLKTEARAKDFLEHLDEEDEEI